MKDFSKRARKTSKDAYIDSGMDPVKAYRKVVGTDADSAAIAFDMIMMELHYAIKQSREDGRGGVDIGDIYSFVWFLASELGFLNGHSERKSLIEKVMQEL